MESSFEVLIKRLKEIAEEMQDTGDFGARLRLLRQSEVLLDAAYKVLEFEMSRRS